MPKKRKNLSHEEIWDDSALVQSWDEALEEYKLYHSIHARGENVEEVLRRLEQDQNGEAEADDMDTAVEDGRVGNGSSKERARPHGNGSLKWSGVDQHPDTKGPAPSEKENAGVNGLDHGDAASKNVKLRLHAFKGNPRLPISQGQQLKDLMQVS
ncbi:MAG: hypothetical protein M1819_005979 [Sarea resinae]|nr:MAG: hypothetical protein M1819_005979 [Sarea resinae]